MSELDPCAWPLDDLARVIGGAWIAPPPSDAEARGLAIDTRALTPGQLFAALPGDRVDGHDFLRAAADAGASAALIARQPTDVPPGLPLLHVDDVSEAMLVLARVWREALRAAGVRVIAVTGSNGKTTTVRLIAAALGGAMRVRHAPKSFNNRLGVPITLLNAGRDLGAVVCEIGMNASGEIDQLAELVRPDISAVTSVGRAHIGAFEGDPITAIAREKTALLRRADECATLIAPEGPPAIEPFLEPLAPERLVRVGVGERAHVRAIDLQPTERGLRFRIAMGEDVRAVSLPLVGRHNAHNAAVALAVARACGVDLATAIAGLEGAERAPMRLEPVEIAGYTILNDAYNANPDSMRAAIRTLIEIPARRRIAVLGDMLELGDESEAYHRRLGVEVASGGVHRLVAVGAASRLVAEGARGVAHVESIERPGEADFQRLAESFEPGDVVLLKGSRAMALERLLHACQTTATKALS
ncbi:MAG: UDP-N-acetylmuramoyl-tripeptide--D-alanyl-D-alanine ligase [Planctomycetota bacterium]